MYQDMNGNVSVEDHYFQQGPLRFERKRLYSIKEETCTPGYGYLTSEVPDVDVDLLCDEVIEDWDEIDDYTKMKASEKLPVLSDSNFSLQDPDCRLHVYDDYTPPNSPVTGVQQEKPTLYLQNRYVNTLLQIWRDNQGPQEFIEPNLLAIVSDSDDSDDVSMPTDSNASSQTSDGSAITEDLQPIDIDDNAYGSESGSELVGNGTLHTADPETESLATQSDSQMPAIDELSTELDHELVRAMFPHGVHDRSGSFSPRLDSPYSLLRSVSPRILRSPSPILSRSSSPRFLQSPGLDDLQGNLSDFPLEDMDAIVFPGTRYTRSRSPHVTDFQTVPDADMEFYEAVANSEEYPLNYRQHRMANSCQDQVVPEYIEE